MKNSIKLSEKSEDLPVESNSTWLNPGIRTKEQLKNWILTKLGYPLLTVELTDSQIDSCIADGISVYSKFAYTPEKYLVVNTKYYEHGVGLNLHGQRIMSVKEISTQRDNPMGIGMDMFFSPYAFFGQGGMGASPFFNQANVSPTGSWITYQNAMEWYKLAKRMTGSNPDFQYDKTTQYLKLFPEPRCGNQDHFILLTVNQEPPIEEYFGNEYCRRLILAECKILLGTIRKKFQSVQLLGGGTLDTSIADEGREEKQAAMDELIKTESRGQSWIIA